MHTQLQYKHLRTVFTHAMIDLPTYLPIYLSTYLSAYLSIYLSILYYLI